MAKRFTDTDKWKRPWFRTLSLKGKVLWQFLCDNCDHAGIAIIDFELCSFQLGFKISEAVLKDELGNKVIRVDDDKYFIPSFFDFQYSHSKEKFSARVSALKILSSYGLIDELGKIKTEWGDCGGTLPPDSMESPSISIGISKGISNKGGAGGKTLEFPLELQESFDTFWQAYPHKVDKERARKNFARERPPIADLLTALEKYKSKKPESQAWKNPGTFISEYKSCLEPDYGQTLSLASSTETLEEIVERKRREREANASL